MIRPRPLPGESPAEIAIEAAGRGGGAMTAAVSALALFFSAYSLWDSSLKGPDLKLFVAPVIQFSAPYNNSNFEVVAVPVTILNDGGRTGTVLSMGLEVTNPKTNETKRFYAADFGRWTMEKTRASAYEPFAPLPLAGKSSRTETILFYTNGDGEKPAQIISEPGTYKFKLLIEEAEVNDWGALDRAFKSQSPNVAFDMDLRYYDARAFLSGTLPLYSATGRAAKSGVPQN